jgi:altronate dehydratase
LNSTKEALWQRTMSLLITRDLTSLAEDIVAAPTHALNSAEDEASLKKLASTCQGIGEELPTQLESLRVQPSRNNVKHGLESFRKSLRSARKKGKIQSIDNRLKRVQDQVKINILNLLRFVIYYY